MALRPSVLESVIYAIPALDAVICGRKSNRTSLKDFVKKILVQNQAEMIVDSLTESL